MTAFTFVTACRVKTAQNDAEQGRRCGTRPATKESEPVYDRSSRAPTTDRERNLLVSRRGACILFAGNVTTTASSWSRQRIRAPSEQRSNPVQQPREQYSLSLVPGSVHHGNRLYQVPDHQSFVDAAALGVSLLLEPASKGCRIWVVRGLALMILGSKSPMAVRLHELGPMRSSLGSRSNAP